eukprot:CAMPEP_0172300754 /NCGR_PEP_ID=MMETSP1058-20130122/2776_1 /TAXON_ID=83371 /ORGANISM="Detonula confervacea, Strain CCMP 353" /LENGTH=364 /DNA_ID=CAMNT_0013010639 /DNA_START=68 /DNA_END=1159 /DNA_ORIENTATION=-
MSTFELINTGIIMGIIHVLTGPDHLSALATLVGTKVQSHTRRDAFLLGVRWGIGHSVGLLLVGGLLIAMQESSGEWIGMDPVLTAIFESFVGLFMLALGAYGLFKADKNNRECVVSDLNHHSSALQSLKLQEEDMEMVDYCPGGSVSDDIAAQMEDVLETDSRCDSNADLSACLSSDDYMQDYLESTGGPADLSFISVPMSHDPMVLPQSPMKPLPRPAKLMSATSLVHKHADNSIISGSSDGPIFEKHFSCINLYCGTMSRRFFRCTPGILAIVVGVVHGVAGPGGVLGVIPAVELRDAKLAIIYLGSFCLTSTFVMGGFAAFYGSLSEWMAGGKRGGRRSGSRVFMVEVGSALLSVCVGFIW